MSLDLGLTYVHYAACQPRTQKYPFLLSYLSRPLTAAGSNVESAAPSLILENLDVEISIKRKFKISF